MVELTKRKDSNQQFDLFQTFICLLIAFNNIYTTITEMKGRVGQLININGSIRTHSIGSNQIPIISNSDDEAEELDIIFNEFDRPLIISLI
jgi:hypothetical protein